MRRQFRSVFRELLHSLIRRFFVSVIFFPSRLILPTYPRRLLFFIHNLLKVCRVDEVVDVAVSVGYDGVLRGEPPLAIDDELVPASKNHD